MSGHKGLAKWFKQDWRDIGSRKKDGGFAKCGRSKQKKTLNESILNVSPLQKQQQCQKDKLNQQFQGNVPQVM